MLLTPIPKNAVAGSPRKTSSTQVVYGIPARFEWRRKSRALQTPGPGRLIVPLHDARSSRPVWFGAWRCTENTCALLLSNKRSSTRLTVTDGIGVVTCFSHITEKPASIVVVATANGTLSNVALITDVNVWKFAYTAVDGPLPATRAGPKPVEPRGSLNATRVQPPPPSSNSPSGTRF